MKEKDAGKQMFGVYLKQGREGLKLSQVQFAKKIKVDTHTVSNWESGLYYPPPKKIKLLAKVFGVAENDILKAQAQTKYEKYRPEYEKRGEYHIPGAGEDFDEIEKRRKLDQSSLQIKFIPLIDNRFKEDPNTFLEKPDSWKGEQTTIDLIPARMFGFRLLDHSMEPEIQQGSIVICDKYRPIEGQNCKVLIKIKNSEPILRTYTNDNNQIIIRPSNPNFPIQVVKQSEIEWKYAVILNRF